MELDAFQSLRLRAFTSSECYRLIPKGKRNMTDDELAQYRIDNPKSKAKTIEDGFTEAGMSYIMDKIYQTRMCAPVDSPDTGIASIWGLFCEKYVFQSLPTEYELLGDVPHKHPIYGAFWVGSPDVKNHRLKATGEIKCPYTRRSFCKLVEPIYRGLKGIEAINYIRENHSDGEKYYWQLVSNSCILGYDFAELIIFMPKESELEKLRDFLYCMKEDEQRKYHRLWMMEDERIPFIPESSEYQSMNKILFEIPDADKELCRVRITDAYIELQKQFTYEKVS